MPPCLSTSSAPITLYYCCARSLRMRGAVKATISMLLVLGILVSESCAQIVAPTPSKDIALLEAVQSTLANHPLLRLQEAQVEITRGQQEQASGQFDLLTVGGFSQDRAVAPLSPGQQEQNALSGLQGSNQTNNLTSSNISTAQLFRSGLVLTSKFQLGRSTDNLFNTAGLNSSGLSLSVTVPLMRGRGHNAIAAQEDAAQKDIDAAMLDLNQLVAQLVANTANSYWNFVAARKNLIITEEAELRGKAYLHNVQELVAADHVPRNDLNEVTANLAQRSSNRVAATQQLVAAQQQLALDMGLNPGQLLRDLPGPANDFPDGENQQLPSDDFADLQYYLDQALQRRADYLASERRAAGKEILLKAAANSLLPQINLNFSGGYAGLQGGRQVTDFFSSAAAGVQGPNATAGIYYTFSGRNQAARGALRQVQGQMRQAELQSGELHRNISASIVVAVRGVRNAILRLRKARESVESFAAALSGERLKYSGGIGSILNILTVEDKLTAAMTDQIQAQLAYALALTQFRFVTGTFVARNRATTVLESGALLTLPFTSAPQEHP